VVEIELPYGGTHLILRLPDTYNPSVLKPRSVPPLDNPSEEVARVLDSALANRPLPTEGKAIVVVSDNTRPVPNSTLLPPLLERMEAAGIARERITLLLATGLHSPTRDSELPALLGPEVHGRYRVVIHDATDCSSLCHLGATSRGTPIWINRRYVDSPIRVLTGMIEPHQFVGFTGGAKSVAIGIAGEATIEGNHSQLYDPRSELGVFEGNPTRAEIEEIHDRVPAQLALNVILNNERQIASVLAGSPSEVERAGVERSARLCQVEVPHPFDVVVASPGGHPKDLEVYQAQKAVAHAAIVVREGGTIILVAECPDGSGDTKFEEWMAAASTPAEVLERFHREGFRMGAHKAFLLARSMAKARVLLVSDRLPLETGKRLQFEQHTTLDSAVDSALSGRRPSTTIAVMPKASSTIPRLSGS
jgi:lactate racemase